MVRAASANAAELPDHSVASPENLSRIDPTAPPEAAGLLSLEGIERPWFSVGGVRVCGGA
jgi:hypothetical protein